MLIAGPNLTFDRTVSLPALAPGEVLRARRVAVTPGGKGVNVARVCRELGHPAVLVGLLPGRTGAACAALLADEGIELRGVATAGELRSATVMLEDDGRVTVLNEPGAPVAVADWERLERVVADALDGHRVLACSGSLPPQAPPDAYARLATSARARGVIAVVDVAGAQLAAAVAGGADLVCPNLAEAEGLLRGRSDARIETGGAAAVRRRAEAAALALVAGGARRALVTADAAGAAFADAAGVRWIAAAPVAAVRNPIGAGDAVVGGLGVALERGLGWAEAVAAGLATGAASVETEVAGLVDPARVAALTALSTDG